MEQGTEGEDPPLMSPTPIDCYANKLILAPMVRIGTLPMRALALEMGADIVFGEEIIDRNLHDCKRVWNAAVGTVDFRKNGKLVFRTDPVKERGRCVFQLGTPDAVSALKAAREVAADVAGVDINMGCPKAFSTGGGMGAALLSKPDTAVDIIKTLKRNLPVPVTCKIRLLETDAATVDLARALEQAGASMLTVHTRLKEERPRHPAHWDRLRPIVDALSIPVAVNGDVFCYEDIAKVKVATGCSSVMIARAAMWNPSCFRPEGPLPVDDILKRYLQQSVVYDYYYKNTKYVLAQVMEGASRTKGPYQQAYQDLTRSKGHFDMCKVFDINAEWYESHKVDTFGGVDGPSKAGRKKRKAAELAASVAEQASSSTGRDPKSTLIGDCDAAVVASEEQ